MDYWDKSVETLNTLFERRIINSLDANIITGRIPMPELNDGLFSDKLHHLASVIRDMVSVFKSFLP